MPTVNLREFVQSTKQGGHMYEIKACCYKSLGYIYTWPSCLQRVGVLCTIAASHPSLSIYLCVKHEKFILIDSCLKCPINLKFFEQPYMTSRVVQIDFLVYEDPTRRQTLTWFMLISARIRFLKSFIVKAYLWLLIISRLAIESKRAISLLCVLAKSRSKSHLKVFDAI